MIFERYIPTENWISRKFKQSEHNLNDVSLRSLAFYAYIEMFNDVQQFVGQFTIVYELICLGFQLF